LRSSAVASTILMIPSGCWFIKYVNA
jgi:hypothetical protein